MADVSRFDSIRIGIASSEDIESWSHGEVRKPETINYRTFKPERDGLFCEKIFGPVKDYECSCGRYKKIKYKGILCERCGVEVTRSKVRRERMGHIRLAAPVCHIWYLKGVPSPISLVLDISPRQLEKVIYFASFIVIDVQAEQVQELYSSIQSAVESEKLSIQESMRDLEIECVERLTSEMRNNPDEYFEESYVRERLKANFDRIKAEFRDADEKIKDLDIACELLGKLKKHQLIDEDKWRAIRRLLEIVGFRLNKDLLGLVRANVGAEAIKDLLYKVDLERLVRSLRQEVVVSTSQRRARAIKRLELVEALILSKSRPESMILDYVPTISPELRPMVQLDGGRFATSDLNDLYRRIINRNNRLKKIMEIQAPESIINHEKRLLQEAVDALIDNGRRQRPVVGSNSRPLKSLSDMLKGKEGRFRKNLLGKRVDYSGRSVIVVGPSLKLHQCGLPKEMALELFKPFVMKALVEKKITQNIKTAKRMIDRMHPAVWDGLDEVIREHPVLLNRAPTLHRLGIQAFEPVIVEGKAIQIHPLVCHAYNADFDGDQMAVHVPLSAEAQAEARVLMLSTQNLFSPADGRPTISPVQDIVLGSYALTMVSEESKSKFKQMEKDQSVDPENRSAPYIYASTEECIYHFECPSSSCSHKLNDLVNVRIRRPVFRDNSEVNYRDPYTGEEFYYVTEKDKAGNECKELQPYEQNWETVVRSVTTGQLLFHNILPYPLRHHDDYLNIELTGKRISSLVVECHQAVGTEFTVKFLDELKSLGFHWAMKYGISVALTDMDPPARREEILEEADTKSARISEQYRRGLLTFNEMQQSLVNLWMDTYDQIGKELVKGLKQFNPLSIITVSGARGSVKQLAQLSGMRGLMLNQFNQVIYELPVKNSFHIGLKILEYFITTFGARKAQADTALRTADAGYLTRRLVDVSQDMIINQDDCGSSEGIEVYRIISDHEPLEKIGERIYARVSLATLKHPKTKEVVVNYGDIISKDQADQVERIENNFLQEIEGHQNEEDRNKIFDQYRDFGYLISEHGLLGMKIRSPLACELEQGVCAKCYGLDLSTRKLVEKGVAVGIIAAQSIGEPGTQLTMDTFHSGGVAGSGTIARTNQYKTGKFIKQFLEDFGTATGTDFKEFDPTKLLDSQESVIRSLMGDAAAAKKLADDIESAKKSEKKTKAAQKAADKMDAESKKLWDRSRKTFFYTWTGESSGIVRVEEIFEARKQPRGKAIICPISGKVKDIQESPYGRWVIIDAEVPITTPLRDAYISEAQSWPTKKDTKSKSMTYDGTLDRLVGQRLSSIVLASLKKHEVPKVRVYYPILVPPIGKLPIGKGAKVIKGDPLTEGPLDPHEVLELAGANAVYHYFISNLQLIYKTQGVDINDKHIEVIIRQMLSKRQIKEPGDTKFLPGQIVDRFKFTRENDRVRELIQSGKKIKYIDPITGEKVEREPKEATATWILLGITEASLATDSFLSAASFQKTTRVLTEAAVRGKKDGLVGLKENVIIGRLIPAGTGMQAHRDIAVEVQRSSPTWSQQSLLQLVEGDDSKESEELKMLDFPSLADMAKYSDHDFNSNKFEIE